MNILLVLLLLQNGKDTELLGDQAFTQGDYDHALEYYYDAYDSPLVFVKRARVLSILRFQGLACDYDAYIESILECLCWAIEQDSSMLPKITNDTLFHEVAQTVLFNVWMGFDLENDTSLTRLLPRVQWYNHVEPITATGGQMVFHDDGVVYVDWGTFYEYDEKTQEITAVQYGEQTGCYQVEKGAVIITWDDGTKAVYRLELRGTCGVLIDASTGHEVMFDHPDECNT
ncbi:hypothetical protein JXB22_02225 [candidate division WOR-3 bacterium]|nr:hypothetical protein [candidate division WOR-3 bacterium]